MIAACSPASYNYDETLSTLRYAKRAKSIKNKPRVNEDPKDALLKQYEDEIKQLKEMLSEFQKSGGAGGPKIDIANRLEQMNTFKGGNDVMPVQQKQQDSQPAGTGKDLESLSVQDLLQQLEKKGQKI
jgi:uncharacterized membrane protein YukC